MPSPFARHTEENGTTISAAPITPARKRIMPPSPMSLQRVIPFNSHQCLQQVLYSPSQRGRRRNTEWPSPCSRTKITCAN